MERLTKQNQDLEEQLRQKNAAMGTQEENQEGTNAEQRNQEGLEGSNAPSRPEWQNLSHPSLTNTAPPHIVIEMQMMKERMDFMVNALDRKLRWSQGPSRSLGILQDPDAPPRSGRRDHV